MQDQNVVMQMLLIAAKQAIDVIDQSCPHEAFCQSAAARNEMWSSHYAAQQALREAVEQAECLLPKRAHASVPMPLDHGVLPMENIALLASPADSHTHTNAAEGKSDGTSEISCKSQQSKQAVDRTRLAQISSFYLKSVVPTELPTDPWDSARVGDYNRGWNDCRRKVAARIEELCTGSR